MDRKKRRLESQLCSAVINGEPRSVQLLLSQGAIPDLVGRKGVAAIHLAVGKETEKNMRSLKMLLQHGADPNVKSLDGLTPLHIAAIWGCYQNLKLLLMHGGNPNIKDNEGNTPKFLAEQEDNRKCAQLLLDYQSNSEGSEEKAKAHLKYAIHSDLTDTSGYPESGYSFTSQSSAISDLEEAPLSSTRLSSFFNCSDINGRTISKEAINSRPFEGYTASQHNLNTSTFLPCTSKNASLLSSTRISTFGPTIHFPKENDLFSDDDVILSTGGTPNLPRANGQNTSINYDPLSGQANRKSVGFSDDDKYFPFFSPEFPQNKPTLDDTADNGWMTLDLSEYSGFLDSERIATVLPQQGIDVTSPDHVFVFSRESTESTDEDMDKTVISRGTLSDSNKKEGDYINEFRGRLDECPADPREASSSSGGNSSYNSCESDHYTSVMEIPIPPTLLPLSEEVTKSGDGDVPKTQSEALVHVCKMDKQSLVEDNYPNTNMLNPAAITLSEADHQLEDIQPVISPEIEEPFILSPFITDRTDSRKSHYSLRTSNPSVDIFSTSYLFEETFSKPVRTRDITPRTQQKNSSYSSPRPLCFTWSNSERTTGQDALHKYSPDTLSNILGAGSCVNSSQLDTFILPKSISEAFVESKTLCDTVILEANQNSSVDSYERNLAEVIQAIQGQEVGFVKDGDFLTDDVTSTDEPTEKPIDPIEAPCLPKEDFWITGNSPSQVVSSSSSSSSSYFSPRRLMVDSDIPCTPGTPCRPRYSMSRLSNNHRSKNLANLSYTPGGRPHIEDADEPVEYLYTDMEQGYKLIEAHIPPSSNSSCNSSMSSSTSEDTILYDWRAMQTKMQKDKENHNPPASPMNKKTNEVKSEFSMEIEGMTDKELRRRLLEVGESPGPISRRTRPVYIRRLCSLLQELNSKSSQHKDQVEQPKTAHFSYSPELNLVLRTFKLPECQGEEQALCQQFDQPDQNKKWREGNIKSSFNYLLLDPRVTRNLPFRSHSMTPQECFQTFVHAIFYVGKGKRSRPYSHLYEALEYYKGDKTSKKLCSKVQQILQVWSAGQGVISLHCFQNVIPVEAYTREACMVEAIGLKMLTNVKRGDFYGVVSNWPLKKKRELGVHLLYRAMQIFLAEGERQLRPADIRH
ncbi:uncharacterized protein LOC144196444 [Stigmatopora nigra]